MNTNKKKNTLILRLQAKGGSARQTEKLSM
ncbi:hypothetical protein MCERE19_03266 [Spirosomataceae bacterium]